MVAADSSITRVGDFLRKSKIDELPQLVNILLGEMSFVGPRPEIPEFANKYRERDRQLVFSVLPGMTDFASIRFRNENELLARQMDPLSYYEQVIMPMKLRYYRFYIARASLRLDIYIMALTVRYLITDIVAHYFRKNHLASSAICSCGDDASSKHEDKGSANLEAGISRAVQRCLFR
jgi:lipopolysaccharide/colanic/teichoic acid biosynthesis glycosyltransferase